MKLQDITLEQFASLMKEILLPDQEYFLYLINECGISSLSDMPDLNDPNWYDYLYENRDQFLSDTQNMYFNTLVEDPNDPSIQFYMCYYELVKCW